ncbi:hypothetical protein J3R82DRAFT_9449 [Butyriboletus roseoflavus]|nr:hypothetical protein J3R82DRAFT_9449 [Butyriboletus roseoflavus]
MTTHVSPANTVPCRCSTAWDTQVEERLYNSDEELDGSDSIVGGNFDSQMLDISRHINDELNLEVAIRERLATTIEGRIQWALQMLDALSNLKEPQGQPLDGDDFQDAALDALEALEAPSSFIFDTGLPEERSPSPISSVVPNQPASQRAPKTRSSRTPKPSQQKKHLYIKLPSTTSDSQLAILACPTCSRTQFTTLQGLLNHARLAHGVEWASHDACITACAIPISADAQSWETYERDGVEVPWGGSVVGLRRLFERAVGVDGIIPTPPLAHATSDVSLENSATAPSTLLSRTLGLHADSPALAQFLGRAPKRRCIHVYDEDQHVDIVTLDGTSSQQDGLTSEESAKLKTGFYMRYPHRNTAREDFGLVVDVDTGAETNSTPAIVPAGTTASRFRITARIRLEDRSLYLKEDRRTQLGITDQYRWMLGVTAPSYSLPLSSFMTCVAVEPPRTTSPVFLTVRQQPFAIVGTANEPFMAKVIFEWVGGGKMEVEHWVDLDQSKSYASVFGSEQLIDVELDRNTQLLPVPKGSPPPIPSLDRQPTSNSPLHNTPHPDPEHGEAPTIKEEHYEQVLRSLLPRVPMTAKDVKPRITTQIPYKLVASPAHLLALVPGRRKAIEWARARALHALYVVHMASFPPCRQTILTVGDVYIFLEDGLYFPRPSHPALGLLPEPKKKGREKHATPILGEESCATCGIKKRLHPGYDVKREVDGSDWTCAVVPAVEQRYGTRLPLTNLTKVLAWPDGLEQAVLGPPLPSTTWIPNQALKMFLQSCQHTPRDLVTFNPPELILAVHKVVSKLRLPTFPDSAPCGENSVFLANKATIERCLAPAALLSASLKPFISTLLLSAAEIAKRDSASTVQGTKNARGKKKFTFVLTPGHILRGLRLQPSNSFKAAPSVTRTVTSCEPRAKESAALCLARLGVRLDFGKVGSGTRSGEHFIDTTVKAEPE